MTGTIPPLNQKEWQEEFEKYKQTPEFHMMNSQITLSEFKSIFYWEWSHRILGRLIGLTFVLPAAYFIARRQVSKKTALRLLGIGSLIGLQGAIGWWMVKSGISDDLKDQGGVPRVSQYRLATHLGAAFVLYSSMIWWGLEILAEHRMAKMSVESRNKLIAQLSSARLRLFKGSVAAMTLLVFATAISGAFVAGLDAGLIYNEFPYMGHNIIPPKKELIEEKYARSDSDLVWRNMFENPVTVQFNHRVLATTTFCSSVALFLYAKSIKDLPRSLKRGAHGVLGFAFLQASLGIATLIYLVPIPLAAAHQAGSLALLTSCLVLARRCVLPSNVKRLVQDKL